MGKLKSVVWDWMEETGFDLGYDWDNIPDLKEWGWISSKRITLTEYREAKHEEYKSRSNSKTRK